MDDAEPIRIPLRNRKGEVVAHALIDPSDAKQAEHLWHRDASGYAVRDIYKPKRTLRLHREILGLAPGDGLQADHVNRDRLDCRRSNLRIATLAENTQNKASMPGARSPFRGVSWNVKVGKWAARAGLGRRMNFIGYFDREEDADAAASAWRRQHMPFAIEDRTDADGTLSDGTGSAVEAFRGERGFQP
jgi:hypothetical protein